MKKLVKVLLSPIIALSFLASCSAGGGETPKVETYPVFFDGNGGTLVEGQELQFVHNPSEIVPPTYEKQDFAFIGWDIDPSYAVTIAKITAQWGQEGQFVVQFYANGGKRVGGGEEKQIVSDASEINPPVYEKEGCTFVGWSQDPKEVTASTTIAAIWLKEGQFVVTFDGNGGTYVEGSLIQPVYSADEIVAPVFTRPGYDFTGWDPPLKDITTTTEVKAQWVPSTTTYTVTWKNYNGDILDTEEGIYHYGDTPSYKRIPPTKPSTEQYDYVFDGWTPAITPVTSEATYTAKFKEQLKKYTITWENYDGKVLEKDTNVPYGATPTYDGATPTRESDVEYVYSFDGWDPAITTVTGDTTYTAKYKKEARKYTITWKNGSTTLKTDSVAYGATPIYEGKDPTKAQTATTVYVWNGWTPEVTTVTGDATYTATFKNYDITNCAFEVNDGGTYTLTKYSGSKTKFEVAPIYNGKPVTKIGDEAFMDCTALQEVTLSDNTLVIGQGAFSGCTSLTKINIPDEVSEISAGAFDGCASLATITIPELVESIGYHAFYGCSFLTSIHMLATTPPKVTSSFDKQYKESVTFYVPKGYASVYTTAGYGNYGMIAEESLN